MTPARLRRPRTGPAGPPARTTGAVLTLVALLAGLLGGLVTLAGPAAAAGRGRTADSTVPTPLTVRISSISPAVIPRKGTVTITGTVTNDSTETWTAINADPFVGSTPITTRSGLQQAVDTAPETYVGPRFTDSHLFAALGDLAPGETAPFSVSLPRSVLPDNGPGAYWIGIHALGANSEGRDDRADGRARTFITLMPSSASTAATVVVPLRAAVRRDPDGRVLNPETLLSEIGPGGPLSREVAFGASADTASQQVTWLVDPAVLDAAADLADGNPPFTLSSPDGTSPSATATPSPGTLARRDRSPLTSDQRRVARVWLGRALAALRNHPVLGLPYADPDVAAVGRDRPRLLADAQRLSVAAFKSHGIVATPAVAPAKGYLGRSGLRQVGPGSLALLADHGRSTRRTLWGSTAGPTIAFTDTRTSAGGPRPTNALDPLALRQRLLADAAIRALAGMHNPLVVTLPTAWDPGAGWKRAQFFPGLDQPWLTSTSIAGDLGTLPDYGHRFAYPASARRGEIPADNVAAARTLSRTGTVLAHLLGTENSLAAQLTEAGLPAASYDARGDARIAREQVAAIDARVRSQMAGVVVSGGDFVTLSSLEGGLTVSVANNLEQPVTVGLTARAIGGGVTITAPKPVTIDAGQRTTVRLHAAATTIGVHRIELEPVTSQGERLGTPLTLTVRTSQVGRLIWFILIIAGVVLVLAILRRIFLRVRSHRWRQA